jgi:hypothetical protein
MLHYTYFTCLLVICLVSRSFYDAVTAAEVLWLLTAYGTGVMTKDDALGCGKNRSWFVSEILVDVNQKDSNEHAHDYQSTRGQFES